MRLIRAAGGIVWRPAPGGPELLLVHRPRHADWSLPKGKLERGEGWKAAALREVAEETGLALRARGFAGFTAYIVRGRPKLVLFWAMEALAARAPFVANDEVDAIAWLRPRDALVRLDHATERALLRAQRPPAWAR